MSNDRQAYSQATGTVLNAVISAAHNPLAPLTDWRHPLYEVWEEVASQRTNGQRLFGCHSSLQASKFPPSLRQGRDPEKGVVALLKLTRANIFYWQIFTCIAWGSNVAQHHQSKSCCYCVSVMNAGDASVLCTEV